MSGRGLARHRDPSIVFGPDFVPPGPEELEVFIRLLQCVPEDMNAPVAGLDEGHLVVKPEIGRPVRQR